MLEMPRRPSAAAPAASGNQQQGGSKNLSHMLTSHGGEIFIHTLNTSRSMLEDPPSISEGPGGRVTDYRIPDLAEMMKANRLAPWFSDKALPRSRESINRSTTFCPLTISSTTIFNMASLESLQKMIVQEEMSEEDLTECRKAIYALLAMENKGEPLPIALTQSTLGNKSVAKKKEEQYKLMFTELEAFLARHVRTERHIKVLDCLLEVRNKPLTEKPTKKPEQVENALRNLAESAKAPAGIDFNLKDGVLRSNTDSPMSPPPPGSAEPPPFKRAKLLLGKQPRQQQSLLELYSSKIEKENARKHVPFHGTRNLGEKAKLYLNFERARAVTAANAAGSVKEEK